MPEPVVVVPPPSPDPQPLSPLDRLLKKLSDPTFLLVLLVAFMQGFQKLDIDAVPTGSKPEVKVEAEPVPTTQYIILDSEFNRVIEPAIEKIADSLRPGRYIIHAPGQSAKTFTVTIQNGLAPPTSP